jgi:cell division protease FtsH
VTEQARQRLLTAALWAPLLLAMGLLLMTGIESPPTRPVAYSEFMAELRAGRLEEVTVTETELRGRLSAAGAMAAGTSNVVAQRLPGLDERALLSELEARPVRLSARRTRALSWMSPVLAWVLPIALLWVLLGGAARRAGAGSAALTFGKNRARIVDQSAGVRVTFKDVAGVDEAEAELVEVVDFLKNPQKYQKLGGRIPRGVLLVGPPGTGKTLLAKAVAGEAGVAFFNISGSEFVEMFVGVGAARVRDLFEQAKLRAPCIVFIDELDAVGRSRAATRGVLTSNEEREQTLNQLLAEMDGFDTSKGVIILAATNAPESLDPALLRAGRFDRQVVVDRPDVAGRAAILAVHARGVALAPGVDLWTVAARTPGMVGADLANVVNEAALLAARRGAGAVEARDLEEAIDRIALGLAKKSRLMTAAEKERVAYHEAGHAVVALSVPHADPVHRVSIVPRGVAALGHTLRLPTHERFLLTRAELEDELAVMMAGRAAEQLGYQGVISTGAADDLERASELARQMVTRFGMTERLGQLTYGRPLAARFLPLTAEERNYSDDTARAIDEEALRIVEGACQRAQEILTSRRGELEKVAAELVKRESLTRDELDRLLDGAAEPRRPEALTPSHAA